VSLQTFFDNFELLADAPNGIAKLRELILQLAVRGKLLPQNEQNESASALLIKVKAEERRLIKMNLIREPKPLPPIQTNEIPYQIPGSWEWVRLGQLGQIVGGGTPSTDHPEYFEEDGIPWLTPADLYQLKGKLIGRGKKSISARGLEKSSAQLMPVGSVLFSSRAPIGYVAIASNALSTNQGFKSCVPFLPQMSEYLYYFLRAVGKQLDAAASGTTFKEVPGKQFRLVIVPLPPVEEQKRVVAKVNELMRLCDELEARQQARLESRVRLNNATLAPLNNAASFAPEKFEQAYQRLDDNFARLYDSAETVGKLRSTILQLAVQGNLVPQDLRDQPASSLLKEVREEKERQIQEKKSKQIESLPCITESDKLLNPTQQGWAWAWLGDLARFVDYRGKTPRKTESGVKLITAKNVRMGFLSERPRVFISEKTYAEVMTRGFPKFGDILFTTEAPLGNVAQLLTDEKIALAQRVIDLQTFRPLFAEYLKVCLMSPLMQRAIIERATEMPATGIKASKLKLLPVPVPPLQEQKRIVTKTNQLMTLCDELEAKLRGAEADSEKLMNAAVQHVLASLNETSKPALARVSA
jgi:type I restriction enzyme S subunit